jgi:hypothetical protein
MAADSPIEALRRVLLKPTGGVVGLVKDLLSVCQEYRLRLDWQPVCYRVRPAHGEWEELTGVRLPTTVFRALLARLAALCNDRTPDSVSPYGGSGKLSAGTNPRVVFSLDFVNTAAQQRLELMIEAEPDAG